MSSENPTPEPEATDGAPTPPPADPSETKTSQEQDAAIEKQDDQEPVVTQDKGKAVADDEPETAEQKDAAEAWQAVFSPEANAWYFWNAKTNQTTWENPRDAASSSSGDAAAGTSTSETSSSSATAQPPLPSEPAATGELPPIDPDLAWLDPSAARGSSTNAQAARFNARTGRFQVDPKFTPDRISDYQRSHRQQEAYYDVKGWEQQLEGKGLKRAGDEEAEGSRKRPSSRQVEKFKQQKQEKKKKKLTSWLAN
ncbi:hypothetical protein JCM3766R1_005028 [Sporobolomyces carnicolor]